MKFGAFVLVSELGAFRLRVHFQAFFGVGSHVCSALKPAVVVNLTVIVYMTVLLVFTEIQALLLKRPFVGDLASLFDVALKMVVAAGSLLFADAVLVWL
jgi:hypothetical protein